MPIIHFHLAADTCSEAQEIALLEVDGTTRIRAGMSTLKMERARGLAGLRGHVARLDWTVCRFVNSETPDGYSLVARRPTRR